MTIEQLKKQGSDCLRAADIAEADLDAAYLLEYVLHIDRMTFLLDREKEVSLEDANRYMEQIEIRAKHIPLQHITGEQEFMGYSFKVNEHVLIPRQDTEVLVEQVAKLADGKRVLDVCTGSGCIILSLDKLCNLTKAVGVDLSTEALKVARENGNRLASSVEWMESDLFTNVTGTFDIIVSNPPYIETKVIDGLMEEVRCHEPMMALDGGEDGLYFYRKIVEESGKYLSDNGYLCFEIGYNQGEEVKTLMENAGFRDCQIIKDLAGLNRVVMGHL